MQLVSSKPALRHMREDVAPLLQSCLLLAMLLLALCLLATSVAHAGPIKPSITASSNPVYVPTGKTEATTTISWNAGSDYPYCEIYLRVNNGNQSEFARGHDGTKPLTVRAGSTYVFWMIVYLGEKGDNVQTVANLTLTAVQGNPPGPSSGTAADSVKFTQHPVEIPFFGAVKVEPGASMARLSFSTLQASGALVEFAARPPDKIPLVTPAGQKAPDAFPVGVANGFAVTPDTRPTKQHNLLLKGNFKALEPNTTYHYVITSRSADKRTHRYIGKFTTRARTIKVVWDLVHVINDSDPMGAGELTFWGWANHGRPGARYLGAVRGSMSDGHRQRLNLQATIENAPNLLTLAISGRDLDTVITPFDSATPDPPVTRPQDTGDSEVNVAIGEFDLSQHEKNITLPFKLTSMPADGGKQGDLRFEAHGRIEIIFPERTGTVASPLKTAPAGTTVTDKPGAIIRTPPGAVKR